MEYAADSAPPASLGRAFAAERERQGLSRADVAQRMHMSARQVEALETDDYSQLSQGTFLRGYVRNYARLLGMDPEQALSRLADAAPRAPAPRIVVPSQNIRFDPLGERLTNPYVKAVGLALVAIALGFAAMYWWLFIRPTPPAAAARKAMDPVPQNLAAAPVAPPEPVALQPAEPAKEEPAKEEPAREQPKSAPAPAAARKSASERTVRLRFKGESWVEIKDRSGKVLLSQINAPGSQTEVSGRPPFSVVVGNAPDVTMFYEDREFPLEPHTRVAVARFTLE